MGETRQRRQERLEADRARRAQLRADAAVSDVTLAGFLAARLGEDEAEALEAQEAAPEQSGHWHAAYSRDDLSPSDWLVATAPLSFTPAAGPGLSRATAEHIARHDPARVLREVEAGRKILAEYQDDMTKYGYSNALERALGYLAEVYSDHPDYREEWRP